MTSPSRRKHQTTARRILRRLKGFKRQSLQLLRQLSSPKLPSLLAAVTISASMMASVAVQASEPQAPARFQPSNQSRPIWVDRDQAHAQPARQVERLQWKPNRVRTVAKPASAAPSSTTRLVGWEDRAIPMQRPANVSPFDDPFGDRVAQNSTTQNSGAANGGNFQPAPNNNNFQPAPNNGNFQPAPNNGNFQPLPNNGNFQPLPNNGNFQPAPGVQPAPGIQPGPNGIAPPVQPGNPPLPPLPTNPDVGPINPAEPAIPNPTTPNPAVPNPTDPVPAEPTQPAPLDPPPALPPMELNPAPTQPNAEAPCEQIYNGRNCCTESERCKLIANYIAEHSIAGISLSVSPRFAPNETLEDEAAELATRLANAPARTWRNRAGKVLGHGRMTNFQNGKVLVTQDSGEIIKVFYNELSDDDTCFVAAYWGLPSECVLSDANFVARNWQPSTFTWKASAACHKPLYFDQAQVERYGHSMGPLVQPIYSGAHFFTDAALLPYKMGIHPLNECQYPLGYYRAGNCAPWLVPPVPISLRGALLEAGVWTGLPFIIP